MLDELGGEETEWVVLSGVGSSRREERAFMVSPGVFALERRQK